MGETDVRQRKRKEETEGNKGREEEETDVRQRKREEETEGNKER